MGQSMACCAEKRAVELKDEDRLAGVPARHFWERQVHYASELKALWKMPQEDIDKFFGSHEVMAQEKITCREDEDKVVDWYRVLNHFCALGNVEKMYIAPVIDPKVGNEENQRLFEEKMARMIGATPGGRILDLGCGKGRIANEVASYSGAKVSGLNYDESQIEAAKALAEMRRPYGVQMEFFYGSFNDKLPFEDATFDGVYEVGAFCYAIDKVALFKEIKRVLKPGGKFSYCDWCRVDYNPDDKHHVELLSQVKPLTGMVEMPFPKEVAEALEQAGLKVEVNEEASCEGCNTLASVVGDTERSFWLAEKVVNGSTKIGMAPRSLKPMWDKIREGGQALVEAVELNLFSMTWHIVAQKEAEEAEEAEEGASVPQAAALPPAAPAPAAAAAEAAS